MNFTIINYWKHYIDILEYFHFFTFHLQWERSDRLKGYIYCIDFSIIGIYFGIGAYDFMNIHMHNKQYYIKFFNFVFKFDNMMEKPA